MSESEREPIQELSKDIGIELVKAKNAEYRKLLQIMQRIAAHLESERGTVGRLMKNAEKNHELLNGEDGLNIRLDRLSQDMKRRQKMNAAILTAVISVIVIEFGKLLFQTHAK